MLACQICNRKILFNELVMFGRPDGGVEPKDVPFVLATQAYLMPNCLIACTSHPPPEIGHKLRQRHLAIYRPNMMPMPTQRGSVPCVFFQQGRCKKGNMCTFIHGAPGTQPRSAVCAFWIKGNCRFGATCRYQHVSPAPAHARSTTPMNGRGRGPADLRKAGPHEGSAVKSKKKKTRQHNGAHADADGNSSSAAPSPMPTLTTDDATPLPTSTEDSMTTPAADVLSEGLGGLKIAGEDVGKHAATVTDAQELADSGVSASSSGTPSPLPVKTPSATTAATE